MSPVKSAPMHRAAESFLKSTDFLTAVSLYIAMAIIIVIVGLICLELSLVHLFGTSLQFMDEVVSQLVAVFAFLSIGYCLREKALIRVEVIYARFNPLWRSIVDIVYSLVSLLYVGILGYYLIQLVSSSYSRHIISMSILRTPIWIPQIVLVLGAAILILGILADIIRQTSALSGILAVRRNLP